MKLTAEAVGNLFQDCLFQDGKDRTNHIKVEGITFNAGFNPQRLESHREEIMNLLLELSENFQADKGGGWSFLEACNDRHGDQWTGLHIMMEQLFMLGIGLVK